jgi:hypothetical protein
LSATRHLRFALVVSYGKWRWALKGAGWTNGEKRIAVVLVTAIFLVLAALDAFYNHLGSDNSDLDS